MGIKQDVFSLSRQFVSIDELVFELTELEDISEEDVFVWLLSKNILDELTLFQIHDTTKSISVLERNEPLTIDKLHKFIGVIEDDAKNKLKRTLSIRNFDDFAQANTDVLIDFFENVFHALEVAPYCSINGHDDWYIKFERFSNQYDLFTDDLNIGWKREELSAFLKKYDIELNQIIEYPTHEERQQHLALKSAKRNRPKKIILDCESVLDVQINDSRIENAQLKQRIAELEQQLEQAQQATNKANTSPDKIDVLAYILDHSQENYAPDLALSIQLYKYAYIDNPRQDSHSSKANLWIKKHTGYDIGSQSGNRIREITAPLNGWSPQRDKNFLKK